MESWRSARLVIEKLQNLGSTPDAIARLCILGAKLSTRCGGLA